MRNDQAPPDMFSVRRQPLARNWEDRRTDGYDVVIIGSGYGGAITAARLATAEWPDGKPSMCLLERGKEWLPGQFPDEIEEAQKEQFDHRRNPLGLYRYTGGTDIVAIHGSGLGGTSLINANVAIQPDPELFHDPVWPQPIRDASASGRLQPYYDRVRRTLRAETHPQGESLSKIKTLKKGAEGAPDHIFHLNGIAVNFDPDGPNHWGVAQRKCLNCGDCITGCNVGAKNTLDTNYLAIARHGGADLFPQVEALRIQQDPAGGGYLVHYVRRETRSKKETGVLRARRTLVLAAGSIGSTELLLRSSEDGLSLPNSVGSRFGGNGDFLAFGYNADHRTDDLGWGAFPLSEWARRIQPDPDAPPQERLHPGPAIVASVRYGRTTPLAQRVTLQDASIPLMYVEASRVAFSILHGTDTDPRDWDDNIAEARRRKIDFFRKKSLEEGALNHTQMYFVMSIDDAGGRIKLNKRTRQARIDWPKAGKDPIYAHIVDLLRAHTTALGGSFIRNPIWFISPWRTLLTAHPLGGCPMGDDPANSVVNHQGRVFDKQGNSHKGLYIADGAIIPRAIGVNPFLTISALTERIAEGIITELGGLPRVLDRIV